MKILWFDDIFAKPARSGLELRRGACPEFNEGFARRRAGPAPCFK